jgi:DNA polymerase III sliding clamp (beta) subunit (PCNA family)
MKLRKILFGLLHILDKHSTNQPANSICIGKDKVAATNMIVITTISVDRDKEFTEDVLIPSSALQDIRKVSKGREVELLSAGDNKYKLTCEGTEIVFTPETRAYPDYAKLYNEALSARVVYRTRIDAKVLEKIIKVVREWGKSRDSVPVTFSFTDSSTAPVRITYVIKDGVEEEEVNFLLMPMVRDGTDLGYLGSEEEIGLWDFVKDMTPPYEKQREKKEDD